VFRGCLGGVYPQNQPHGCPCAERGFRLLSRQAIVRGVHPDARLPREQLQRDSCRGPLGRLLNFGMPRLKSLDFELLSAAWKLEAPPNSCLTRMPAGLGRLLRRRAQGRPGRTAARRNRRRRARAAPIPEAEAEVIAGGAEESAPRANSDRQPPAASRTAASRVKRHRQQNVTGIQTRRSRAERAPRQTGRSRAGGQRARGDGRGRRGGRAGRGATARGGGGGGGSDLGGGAVEGGGDRGGGGGCAAPPDVEVDGSFIDDVRYAFQPRAVLADVQKNPNVCKTTFGAALCSIHAFRAVFSSVFRTVAPNDPSPRTVPSFRLTRRRMYCGPAQTRRAVRRVPQRSPRRAARAPMLSRRKHLDSSTNLLFRVL